MPNAAVPDRVHILLRARLDVRVRRHLLDRHGIGILVARPRRALVLRSRITVLRLRRSLRLGILLRRPSTLLCLIRLRLLRSLRRRRRWGLLALLLWLTALLLSRRGARLLLRSGDCRRAK